MNMAIKSEIQLLLKMLDSEFKLDTLEDRIKIQKLVYLSEISGIDLGFSFTWYIHGPYSPELTRIMFGNINGKSSNFSDNLTTRKKIKTIKSRLGKNIISSSKLELLSSLHYVLSISKKLKTSDNIALDVIYEQKPQFTKQEINDCLKIVQKFL